MSSSGFPGLFLTYEVEGGSTRFSLTYQAVFLRTDTTDPKLIVKIRLRVNSPGGGWLAVRLLLLLRRRWIGGRRLLTRPGRTRGRRLLTRRRRIGGRRRLT
jgi:hypothetical protein